MRAFLRSRAESLRNAVSGVLATVSVEINAKIEAGVALGVLALGGLLDVSRGDWCWLLAAIALVFAFECVNTAVESLADATAPDPHPLVGRAKDAAAGAVLCASLGAAGIGLMVLGPPLLALWGAA